MNQVLQASAAIHPGVMPTAPQLRSIGMNDLACAITRHFDSFDAAARHAGLAEAQHDSRVGWSVEDQMADHLENLGATVERRGTVKSPWDLKVNGFTVNVKVANGAAIDNGTQWTWRVDQEKHSSQLYLLVADHPRLGRFLFVRPASSMPKTCGTARLGARGTFGVYAKWKDRFDLFGIV